MNALSTDLYQLTMVAGYFHRKVLDTRATFELFVRRLPRNRHLLVSAGLDQALSYLERLQFGYAFNDALTLWVGSSRRIHRRHSVWSRWTPN